MEEKKEFYVGYLPQMPKSFVSRMALTLAILGVVVGLVAFLVPFEEKPFVNSRFEYGEQVELEGRFSMNPYPMFEIDAGDSGNVRAVSKHFILVNFGKFGVKSLLKNFADSLSGKLRDYKVRLAGTLIYYDGKTVLEMTDEAASILGYNYEPKVSTSSPIKTSIGEMTLSGEIVDPKCYFGVMKPGNGKVHRSCAARCIAGGIPPVLKTSSSDESLRCLLVLNEDGKPMHDEIMNWAGKKITVKGNVYEKEDWAYIEIVTIDEASKSPMAYLRGLLPQSKQVVLHGSPLAEIALCN